MLLDPSDLGSTPNNWIGRSQWPDPYFNGRVEDFRIYTSALSGDEIATLIEHGVAPPAPPIGLRAAQRSEGGAVELTWFKAVEADKYVVWRAVEEGDYLDIANDVTETLFVDYDTTPGERYRYRVTSVNAAGESPPSAETMIEIPGFPGTGDAPLSSVRVEGDYIVLTIPAVSGFLYQLQRTETLGTGDWEDVGSPVPASGDEIEFSDLHDADNERVFYRVVIRPDS